MGVRSQRAARLLVRASGLALGLGLAASAVAAEQPDRSDEAIVITGVRNSAGLRADSEIGQSEIDSFGVDTVRDLIDAVVAETDPGGDGPVILINGQLTSGIDEVADLPTEVVTRIQTLSRDAAATLGQRPTRRVINVVIRPDHRQLTLNAKERLATAGQGRQAEGAVNLLSLHKRNRESLALRLASTDRLDEADRDIVSIDGDPGVGRFRSLLPGALVASANGNVTRKIGPSIVSLNLRGERQQNESHTGRRPAIVGRALEQVGKATVLGGAVVANGPVRRWRYSLSANYTWRLARSVSDRSTDTEALDPLLLGTLYRDRARTRSVNAGLLGTLNGSLFKLPAGAAHAALRLEWRANRATSTTDGPNPGLTRRLHRDDVIGQVTMQLPLFASKTIGDIGAELSGALHHVTASGTVRDVGAALNWRPDDRFTLRAAINREQIAPSPNALTDPIVTVDNFRVYDFVRQETVEVTYLTGGNPDLGLERRRRVTVGATWQPLDTPDLNLSLDYTNAVGRGGFAALPPVNADIQAAFPDRFQRDVTGRLVAIDARPVAFGLVKLQELRSGASWFHSFGRSAPTPAGTPGADEGGTIGRGWRVNAFVADQWTLQSERQARTGLPVIDLLDGGALGYGGGQPRHQVQFGGGIVHRGVGLHLNGEWTGSSRIAAGTLAAPDELRFESQLQLNARLFANLASLMPDRRWAKTLRLTLALDNALDSKRRVSDSSGATPLSYQPYLLDPLGRTIVVALRKAL